MTSLQRFANAVRHARNLFHADRSVCAWLAFYEVKQAAYSELVAALPQLKEIHDFWRYVQDMPVAKWVPLIEAEVERIARRRSLCHECGIAVISWPERLCPECKKQRRLETYRKAKERARIKQRSRQCPRCKTEPLSRRQKVCRTCQANARRERNRRYQKCLKEAAIRRVQPKFTRRGTSTIPLSRPVAVSVQSVEPGAVLEGEVA
jgi:hypothetical protein